MKLDTFDTMALPPSTSPVITAGRAKRWRAPLIILVVLAVAGGGWTVLHKKAAAPAVTAAADAAKKAPAPIPVHELSSADIAVVESRALTRSLPMSGSLTPQNQATIKSRASGAVRDTTVQEGMAVTAGQVLARLDPADLNARLIQQQAALDQARAKLSMANKNQLNNQALLQQKYISQTAYDTTQNTTELAQADVKSAAAQVDIARIALDDTVIHSPMNGIVSKRFVQAGDKVSPDSQVYTIVNLDKMTLEAQVPASDIPRVKVGQGVTFKVDGFADRKFSGKVARINPATEAGSRAMLVYVAVDNADGALRAGMFAKGSITTDQAPAKPLLPLSAIRQGQGKDVGNTVVYQIVDNKVRAQPVTLGLRNDDEGYAEVTGGLPVGATVLVAKLEGVLPGHSVKLPAGPATGPLAKAATTPDKG